MTAVADRQARPLDWVAEAAAHAGVAVTYAVVAQLSFRLATVHPVVASVWPPAGLALAILLIAGVRFWPGILVGALLANAVNGIPLLGAAVIALGNTLASAGGAWALLRLGLQQGLHRMREGLLLLAVGALLAPIIAATIGTLALHFTTGEAAGRLAAIWLTWWGGDAIGVMLVTPLLLSSRRGFAPEITGRRLTEMGVLIVSLVLVGLTLLRAFPGFQYVVFLLVGWAAIRFGLRGASLATALVAVMAMWHAAGGSGPFWGTESAGLWRLQVFLALLALNSLVLATMATALRASDLRLRRIFEHAGVGMAIVRPNGRIGEANPAFHRMLGYSVPGLSGRTVAEITHPEDWAVEKAVFTELLAGTPRPFRTVKRYVRHDGSFFWGKLTATHISDGGDGPGYNIGLVEDISEQREAEDALAKDIERRQRSEEELRRTTHMLQTLIDASPLAILALDTGGRVRSWNRAAQEMFGWSEAEVLGKTPPFIPAEALGDFNASIARLLAGDAITGLQVTRRRRDGVMLHVRICAASTRSPEGSIDGIIALIEDVTERTSIGEQLRQAQKMEAVGQLTGGIAHDFNNLLTIIITNAALLADQITADQPDMRAEVIELQRAAHRGADLIRKLMAFSRKHAIELRPVNVAGIIGDTERALRRLLPESIEILPRVEMDTAFMINGDVSALEQILFNLATNARDAMPEGGTLRLGVYRAWLDEEHRRTHGWGRPGEYIVLAVSDTGCGMSPETRARIFDPFFTTKEPGKGTGLGMAMVYGLMKQHNGYIGLYSEPGRGTTFRLYFPAIAAPGGAAGQTEALAPPAGGTESILIVDDEDGIRRSAVRVLTRAGYAVREAADGESALTMLSSPDRAFDLVLTDLVMPRMGGLALHNEILRRGCNARVILMTGHTAEDITAVKGTNPGVKFLNKPWSVTDLLRRVREALDEPSSPRPKPSETQSAG